MVPQGGINSAIKCGLDHWNDGEMVPQGGINSAIKCGLDHWNDGEMVPQGGINSAIKCGLDHWNDGEMAERSNAAVLKTVVPLSRNRGFESLFLRRA